MGTDDTHDHIATPDPDPTTTPEQPLLIVPATQAPEFPDLAPTVASPVAASPTAEAHPPTDVVPVVPVAQPVAAHETHAPTFVAPTVPYETRRPAWPYVAAIVALLVGGLAGYLVRAGTNDDEAAVAPAATVAGEPGIDATLDMLLARTRADGEYRSPSEYAQLDEITAIDNAKATEELGAEVALLADAREDATGLTDQVAVLEAALVEVTAERDALLVEAGTDDGTATDIRADLDAADSTIDDLTDDLTEANTNLEAANATVVERDAEIARLRGQLDTSAETLEALNVGTVPSYVNGAVARARTDAEANGWTLVEQPTVSATSPVGVVLDQAPSASSNMINGSVLYVEVATRS